MRRDRPELDAENGEPVPDIDQAQGDQLLDLLRPIVQPEGAMPKMIRRYRVVRKLGQGAFGEVLLAFDDQLQRNVAIKLPRRELLQDKSLTSHYLAEAQIIAGLDHPNIVPIYDVGSTYDFPCYIVTKYIDGSNLEQTHQAKPFSPLEAIELTTTVADALHFAHRQGIVHRDVKPANILLDAAGKPYVADLGLAIKDSATNTIGMVGTPAYMSPEQARGEGHRVDGRSDIFSLGIVLFELLTGKLPFGGGSAEEVINHVANTEPRPLRQVDDSYPQNLERICMKALARRSSDRYTTARDLADELQTFLGECDESWESSVKSPSGLGRGTNPDRLSRRSSLSRAKSTVRSASQAPETPAPVVPKGLRAFDGHDADFFLRLLPGPVDRNGIPGIIRFWKNRIDDDGSEFDCPLGLIYGPSGCGKSSFIRAGIIPHLAENVVPFFVEASATGTVDTLKSKLRRRFGEKIDPSKSLSDVIIGLRGSQIKGPNEKVLLILDQFEQWLHGNAEIESSELVNGLRQCDGGNVQCLILVRDDFWLALTRFAKGLEWQLRDNENMTCTDLFSIQHAREVLAILGRAYGRLPDDQESLSDQQLHFIENVVDELSDEGRVACLRVSLFADLVKDKPWTMQTLNSLGGVHGIGVSYLRETFDATGSPQRRANQDAARRVLRALLPKDRSEIRGPRKDLEQLKVAAGYADKPQAFAELLHILDQETKLISPVDPDQGSSNANAQTYQITHDYLIPVIRNWNDEQRQASASGRAQLLLEERSAVWNAKPDAQRLPGPIELVKIRRHTRRSERSLAQNRMVSAATRYFSLRALAIASAMLVVGIVCWRTIDSARQRTHLATAANRRVQAETLIQSVETAPHAAVPYGIENLLPYEDEAVPILKQRLESSQNEHLTVRDLLMLSQFDSSQTARLLEYIPITSNEELGLIVEGLKTNRQDSLAWLHNQVAAADSDRERAVYSVIAWDLGDPSLLADDLKLDDSPDDRSYAIVQLAAWRHHDQLISETLETIRDPGMLSGIYLGLWRSDEKNLVESSYRIWLDRLRNDLEHPSSIVHVASVKLSKRLGIAMADIPNQPKHAWCVSPLGITCVRVAAGEIIVGDARKKHYIVEDDFWCGTTEMVTKLFLEFYRDKTIPKEDQLPNWRLSYDYHIGNLEVGSLAKVTDQHPIGQINTEDAFLFCNWLSRREGREACYDRTGQRIKIKNPRVYNADNLGEWICHPERSGYRLPTEAEFQLARLGGAATRYGFGSQLGLVNEFAVTSPAGERSYRLINHDVCGSRLPNNLGIYDMFGNSGEYVHRMLYPRDRSRPLMDWHPINEPLESRIMSSVGMPADTHYFHSAQSGASRNPNTFRVVRRIEDHE